MSYLENQGIHYRFVKTINGITVWKYEKTEELFRALADFYSNVYQMTHKDIFNSKWRKENK